MAKTIDMQTIRHINLFTKVSKIPTKHFFTYNNVLVFGVPKAKVSQAIGKNATNVKKLNQILRRKIKIIAIPSKENKESIKKFITDLVDPIELSNINVSDERIEINATRMNKASLIGRNRTREKELIDILKNLLDVQTVQIV